MRFVVLLLVAMMAGFWLGATALDTGGWLYTLGVSAIIVGTFGIAVFGTRIYLRSRQK